MSDVSPIGLTRGPGEIPQEFTFISPDRRQVLKVGEYITYKAMVDQEERNILSRVVDRQPLRLYPSSFLADPTQNPDEVAALIGYHQRGHELFEVFATIIGYFDENIRDFINPRLPPRTGRPIYLAPNEELAQYLTSKQVGAIGSAHIGSLLSREKGLVPITLDAGAFTGTHLAIIASTGAGKSYLAAVIVEELMKPYNRAAILIIDPHGEYDTLSEMMNNKVFSEDDYKPEVKVFHPGEVKVRVSSLNMGDLFYLLPNLSDRMEYLLQRAYRDVARKSQTDKGDPERWTQDDLQIRLHQLGQGIEDDEGEDGEGNDRFAGTADALIWRIESMLGHSVIFDDFRHLDLSQLVKPGRCSVLQLNEVDEREQQVMVATLLRRLFNARKRTIRGEVDPDNELYLPYPVFLLIEEAHRFAPTSSDIVTTQILKTILGEGRKFGVGVGLISQRPGKLDGDVLSQCNTQFLLRIVNPIDQARVAESVETVGRDLLRELPALTKGQVIVAGDAVNTPILCQVRQRHTRHGGETHNAPDEWMKHFEPSEVAQRERRASLHLKPNRKEESKMYKR
jgi:DNA helicase HerA-like ATPase